MSRIRRRTTSGTSRQIYSIVSCCCMKDGGSMASRYGRRLIVIKTEDETRARTSQSHMSRLSTDKLSVIRDTSTEEFASFSAFHSILPGTHYQIRRWGFLAWWDAKMCSCFSSTVEVNGSVTSDFDCEEGTPFTFQGLSLATLTCQLILIFTCT